MTPLCRRSCLPVLTAGAVLLAGLLARATPARAAETIWLEAEHLQGVRGSCFPDMGQKTAGHWALSGPGIAPEWTQGGESEWLSIACSPDDATASATTTIDVPEAGRWTVWVRYRDWRGQTERFAVKLEQPGAAAQQLVYGDQPVVDDNDELKLYWNWEFGWDQRPAQLAKGPATLTLLALAAQPGHRQIDVICLTTDPAYRPQYRDKPVKPVWAVLNDLRAHPDVAPKPLAARVADSSLPAAWKLRTFRDQGFVYLWNVGADWLADLASQDPTRVLVPFQTDPGLVKDFRAAFGGQTDVPIFADPRIAPAFHNAGPEILTNAAFVAWLDAHPDRAWGNMMNYFNPGPLSPLAKERWPKYQDRYVGNISGENLGYHFDYGAGDQAGMIAAVKTAKSRAEVFDILTRKHGEAIAARQAKIWGAPIDRPYRLTIPCLAVEMIAYAHACFEWGTANLGFESGAVSPSLAMRQAFLRGAARQFGGLTTTYRSSGLGDAHTIFSDQGEYSAPKHVYDNWYDVWAGAGMTWYKFDLWHQYLSGAAVFYHEQGFDEFWRPGGGSTPLKPIQLSPKGRLVDDFLNITRDHPDRGAPFTPIAFLLDRAHGWDPTAYQPAYFGLDPSLNPAVLPFDRHARMLREWFQVAYHPYGPTEASLNTGVNQNFVPGLFGNVFDVLVTAPQRTATLDSYPVVILNGQVTLTDEWGAKLAQYVDQGGTLIAAADQLRGPGVAALKLPTAGATAEDTTLQWVPGGRSVASQRYRYQPLQGGEPLVKAGNGDTIAAAFPRGQGKLVYLSVPLGLGIDQAAVPAVALLLAHARQGLLPVEVRGNVEWLLNRTANGWVIGLLNPAGCEKPQHGVVPTDRRQHRTVKIVTRLPVTTAREWFTNETLPVTAAGDTRVVEITVPAAGARILELH